MLQGKVEIDDLDRKEALRRAANVEQMRADFEKRKDEVLYLLDRLGVNPDGELYNQEAIQDPLLYMRQIEDDMIFNDINALLCYEKLREVCMGVGTVEVVSGRAKFAISVDGLDVFDVLPPAPPITRLLQDINAIREAKHLKPLKDINV